MPTLILIALLFSAMAAGKEELDASEIMNRMAASVEASVEGRRQYVYQQKVLARLLRTSGRVARQETRIYTVTPESGKTVKTMISLDGVYQKSAKQIIHYDKPGFESGKMDIDGGIMGDLIDDLVNDKGSRDGIPHNLFPLRKKHLAAYTFTYKELTEANGRKAYRIAFQPSRKTACLSIGAGEGDSECGDDSTPWKGEVLVDAQEFQPVRINTELAFKIPWGVKVFLGTNIRQVGFSIAYTRLAPNVWFPVSYGTEFRLDLLFGYHRVITLALDSTEFRRVEAKSEIRFGRIE